MPDKPASGPILVADDDPAIRALITIMLEAAGLEVFEAADGKEAIALAGASEFPLAIIDLVMPEKDGLETIRELRKLRPEMRIVAVSGAVPGRVLDVAGLLGADETLAKPFRGADLMECIARLLRRTSESG